MGGEVAVTGLAVAVRGLALQRGGKDILREVELDLAPGTLTACIGPSGCGKSSLLSCLAGLREPSAGRTAVLVAGVWHDPVGDPAWIDHFGLVTQQDHLAEDLDASTQLRHACHHAGLPGPEHADRVAAVLAAVELSDHAQTLARHLSGGQRRRLGIARALIKRPGLLILDEPTSGLDIAVAHEVMDLLAGLARSGTTVLCTSHLPSTLALCDRVLVMGRHAQGGGTVRAALPRSAFLARLSADRDGAALYRTSGASAPGMPEHQQSVQPDVSATELPARVHPLLPWAQVRSVLHRSAAALLHDRGGLALLLLQPLLLAGLILLTQSLHEDQRLRFCDFFGAVAALWLGMSASIRDLVGERALHASERLLGLGSSAYLCARLAWMGITATTSALLLVCVLVGGLHALHPEDALLRAGLDGGTGLMYRLVVYGLCAWSGGLLGLIASALAGSVRAAVAAMPLIVLPQLLISRIATGRADLPRGDERLGAFRDLAAGSPCSGLDSTVEQANAVLGLLMSSRHASWVLDGLSAGTLLGADALGLVTVLLLQFLALIAVHASLHGMWLRSLAGGPGGDGGAR